jgi:6-phosphofructokinase 1
LQFAVITSGGDAPGMNACVRAIVRQSIYLHHEVWGVLRGYHGLLEGHRRRLGLGSVADVIKTGGTFLRTGRCLPFLNEEGQEMGRDRLREWGIDGLLVVGGDGSLRGALALHGLGIPVIGIPASIDNDIYGTDYAIGFDTAINNVTQSMDKIRDTASSHERVFVIEVMGRESGAIAIASGVAGGAETILIPEVPVNYRAMITRIKRSRARGKRHSLIVVAEGAAAGEDVTRLIEAETGYEVRLIILGHTQRGGPPTAMDRILASQLGTYGVQLLAEGKSGVMVGWRHGTLVTTPIDVVVNTRKDPDLELAQLASILSI